MFTKIKHKDGEVTLEWNESARKDRKATILTSTDDPRPEFLHALKAMTAHVLDLCELPADYADGESLRISSVTITDSDVLGMGCVVTALKTLSGCPSPLVLNTPHLSVNGSHDDAPTLRYATIQALETLIAEAGKYRDGQRAQLGLFAEAA